MPRPSLKDQRSREILDAFVSCAARYGIEGATQERIAIEAGVKRTLLRHYLGNRDDMVEALYIHVVGEFDVLTEMLDAALQNCKQPSELIDLLFDTNHATDPRLVLVFQALTVRAETDPKMRSALLASMERFTAVIDSYLLRNVAGGAKTKSQAIAHGLAALYMSSDALTPLDPPSQWRAALKRAAFTLINTMEAPSK